MMESFETTIGIEAGIHLVWQALTEPGLMKQWMGEPGMEVEILTDWKEGNSLVIKGHHHGLFENHGTVRQLEPYHVLRYDYLSSISQLPDTPENRTTVAFWLSPDGQGTSLTLKVGNFPTESIRKHVILYWYVTMGILKAFVEYSLKDQK